MNHRRVKILRAQLIEILGDKAPTPHQWRVWKKRREVVVGELAMPKKLEQITGLYS